MIKLRSLPLQISLCALASACFVSAPTLAQGVAPTVRIVNRIDESQLVTLKGNTHPFATARHDQGKVADSLPMTDLILVLSRDPAQQAAFDAYVASEYDQNSPNYHQWLTPDQVGEQFGPSQTDILTITNWLTGHGFMVSQVTRDRMSIRFSGNAGQVESAFHTEIHNLTVKGEAHIGNMSDPQIPASLSTVVVGVKSLHNFFPKPLHRMGQTVQRDAQSGMWARPAPNADASANRTANAKTLPNVAPKSTGASPQFGINASSGGTPYLVEDVGPWDFATIYNVTPLWTAGIDGKGQTIAIAGTSAIDIGEANGSGAAGSGTAQYANSLNDVTTFRDFFDLPTNNSWNQPIQVSGNSSPLTVCSGAAPDCSLDDLLENSLDVEWSASIAKNAQIVLVASYPTGTSDDPLYDSESYIVDNIGNSSSPVYGVHVMNVSYGECELAEGNSGNLEYYNLWQTAAAEGLAVFVASGDSGSTSCDEGGDATYGTPYLAEFGLSVSGLASTPFNTAVGGTDFNWCPLLTAADATTTSNDCQPAPHWSATELTPSGGSNPSYSALGYVPEVPWNETCTSPLALPYLEAYFQGEPYVNNNNQNVNVTDAETSCNAILYWDAYFYEYVNGEGLPAYIENFVDTVGGSGGRSSCVSNNTVNVIGTSTYTFGTVSSCGTATSIQNGASSIPLTNDGWQKPSWQTGVTGIPNDGVRDIPDVSFFASDGVISSSAYLICVSADSSAYGASTPCSYSSSTEPFAEEVGGTSVATPAMAGVMALINQKTGAAQGSPNKELYTLAHAQTYNSTCSAENATTGDGCYFNDIDSGTIAMPCDYDWFVSTPSPNCPLIHANDYAGILTDPLSSSAGFNATTGYDLATGLGSLNVANVVNAWTTVTPGSTTPTVTVTPSPTSINSNNTLNVTVTVAGGSGAVPPTGSVTLTASGSTYTATNTLNNGGSYTFTIPANNLPGAASPGQSDTLTASYAGDVNYAAKTGTGHVTVTTTTGGLLTPTIAVNPASSTLNSSASLNVTVSITGAGVIPTGTITLSASSGSYAATMQTIGTAPCTSNTSCVFTIPANSLGSGSVTLTANYSGDSNYAAGHNTGSVTVTGSTFTLTPGTPSSSSVTPGQSATVAVTVAPVAGYAGIVTLSCAQSGTTASGSDGTTCTGSGSSLVNLATCSGSTCTVTFTIGTYAKVTAALDRPKLPGGSNQGPGGRGWLGAGSGAILALLVFFGIPARRRTWRSMLSILFVMAALGVMSSCGSGTTNGGGGGGGQNDPGTTAGTYTYTVTASANPSVTPNVTQTFTVTVN